MRVTRVLLVGMMGSGKSSAGRRLSQRTGWPFHDNDALVEQATGLNAREILASRGERALRSAEREALEAGLSVQPPAIIGVAAGTVTDDDARRRLREGGVVVWLHASPEVLARRASGAAHRPWLDDDPLAWFETTGAAREPLYRELADADVDSGEGSPGQTADRILAALEALDAT